MSDHQQPSVGRIVHYVSYGTPGGEYGKECRAAVITEVLDWADNEPQEVGLAILNPSGVNFTRSTYSDEHDGGSWHWPERL